MDLLGPSLDDVFESMKRKFTLRTVLLIALQAFDRLHYLHSRGVVHGDVKGENFLIGLPNEGLDTGKKQNSKGKNTRISGRISYENLTDKQKLHQSSMTYNKLTVPSKQ